MTTDVSSSRDSRTVLAELAPADGAERLTLVDALRGFALAGVLLINLGAFTLYDFLDEAVRAALPTATPDRWLQALALLLVDSKALSLFSLLFGLGFAIQLERAAARAGEAGGRYVRRLLILFAFGLVHGELVWWGDILRFYALFGLGLLLFRRASPRVLWVTGLMVAVVLPALVAPWRSGLVAGLPDERVLFAANLAGFSSESVVDAFAQNRIYDRYALLTFWSLPFFVFGRFLIGFWIGRVGLLHDPSAHRPLLRRLLVGGLAIGLAGGAVGVARDLFGLVAAFPFLGRGLGLVALQLVTRAGVLALALAYLAAFALLFLRPAWRARLGILAPVGRMALSNYLAQTAICLPLFYGFGAGIGPAWGWPGRIAFCVGLFGAQTVCSRWWLERYRFGPVEWLWRTLTYGRAQPMLGPPGAAPPT